MDGCGRHSANRKKSGRGRQILSGVTNMWNLEKKSIEIENRMVVTRNWGKGK